MFDFGEDPLPDDWNRWGYGCGGALLATGTAAFINTRDSIHIPGRRGGITLQGNDVTACALILLALAVFLHVHFFWTGTERFVFARETARVISLVTGLIAFGAILVSQLAIF